MTTLAEQRAAAMTEAQLLTAVRDAARYAGWDTYHAHDSRRSEPGWPDLVIAGHGRVLFRELKTQKGRVTPDQHRWLANLYLAGLDFGIWRPTDLIDGTITRALTGARP